MKRKIVVIVDNEGPCSKNDNAQESTVALAKQCGLGEKIGVNFFRRMSNIDDIWGDFHRIPKDPDYSSGHTLKVVLPFHKAMSATSQWHYKFAKMSLRVVPNIKEVLKNLNSKYEVWQVSTSYEFFIRAFCNRVGFDFAKTRCTFVEKFDEIAITRKESKILLDFIKEVALKMPILEYNEKTGEVVYKHKAYYKRITAFIWEIVWNMRVGELLRIVHPVGQAQKLESMLEIIQELDIAEENVLYVGDSQTDVKCVEYLRDKGLTMMFNGKGKVCNRSHLMYIGEDARVIEEVATLFATLGKETVIDLCTPPRKAKYGGLLATVMPYNIDQLEEMSVKKRKEFRGVHIGELT